MDAKKVSCHQSEVSSSNSAAKSLRPSRRPCLSTSAPLPLCSFRSSLAPSGST
jgi:hypothetical protein